MLSSEEVGVTVDSNRSVVLQEARASARSGSWRAALATAQHGL